MCDLYTFMNYNEGNPLSAKSDTVKCHMAKCNTSKSILELSIYSRTRVMHDSPESKRSWDPHCRYSWADAPGTHVQSQEATNKLYTFYYVLRLIYYMLRMMGPWWASVVHPFCPFMYRCTWLHEYQLFTWVSNSFAWQRLAPLYHVLTFSSCIVDPACMQRHIQVVQDSQCEDCQQSPMGLVDASDGTPAVASTQVDVPPPQVVTGAVPTETEELVSCSLLSPDSSELPMAIPARSPPPALIHACMPALLKLESWRSSPPQPTI